MWEKEGWVTSYVKPQKYLFSRLRKDDRGSLRKDGKDKNGLLHWHALHTFLFTLNQSSEVLCLLQIRQLRIREVNKFAHTGKKHLSSSLPHTFQHCGASSQGHHYKTEEHRCKSVNVFFSLLKPGRGLHSFIQKYPLELRCFSKQAIIK